MTVVDESPGLEVQIFVNDQPAREYEDSQTKVPARTSERFIEAQSGANFEIRYLFKAPFPSDRPVSMIVTIDGKDVDEPLIRTGELYDPKGHVSSGPVSNLGSRWSVQRYCFAPIRIREDSTESVSEELKKKLQPVGIISCSFCFLTNTQRNHHLHVAHKEIEELGTISEKAIKGDALSHHAILGKDEPSDAVEYFDADYADDGEPFATFHFYYRSLAALKDLHIVERTPDPVELLDSDDSIIGQLNREQLEAIVRRFREQEEIRMRMKRERSESVTVVGGDRDVGGRSDECDPDVIEVHSIDLRKRRRMMRVRQVPSGDSEVVELD